MPQMGVQTRLPMTRQRSSCSSMGTQLAQSAYATDVGSLRGSFSVCAVVEVELDNKDEAEPDERSAADEEDEEDDKDDVMDDEEEDDDDDEEEDDSKEDGGSLSSGEPAASLSPPSPAPPTRLRCVVSSWRLVESPPVPFSASFSSPLSVSEMPPRPR